MSTTATRTRRMLEVCAHTSEMGHAMSAEAEPGVALVTGANRGIGREVARQLAERGYEVLIGARDAAQVLSRQLGLPGFVNTDMGGPMGATKPVEDGAAGIVWLATLPDDGPTGGFFRDGQPIAF